ncbi:MAG: hypothetical protein ACLSAF_19955 [Intestinimonas sp.]
MFWGMSGTPMTREASGGDWAVFVGIAPMVLGVAAILLILRLITPEVFAPPAPGSPEPWGRAGGPWPFWGRPAPVFSADCSACGG